MNTRLRALLLLSFFALLLNNALAQLPRPELPVPQSPAIPQPVGYDSNAINRRNLAQLQQDAQINHRQEAQATIEEAVAAFNRKKEPASGVLKESDLSEERKTQLLLALKRYEQVYQELTPMYLGKQPYKLKRAVYLVENAYLENEISYEDFCQQISQLVNDCWQQIPVEHRAKPSPREKHLAIFKVMCDTTYRYDTQGNLIGLRMPMTYDFRDYRGEQNYRQMFVTKLLKAKNGQCHSLPLLYKILADEMDVKAYLAFAPNHSYIRHQDEKGHWYNLELTNGRYVTKHSLMEFGYIKAAALKNRVYMDTLSQKQTIGSCLVDLVLGYDAKFGAFRKEEFIHQCTDLVLKYQPNNVQAWIVKGALINFQVNRAIQQSGYQSPTEVPANSPIAQLHQQQIQIYSHIEALGFAEMPKAQYEIWRASLGREQSQRKRQ